MIPQARKIQVALVEGDSAVREELRFLLESSVDCTCVADYDSAEGALKGLGKFEVDVLLLELQSPPASRLAWITHCKRHSPATEIMMLLEVEDHEQILSSLAAGASGYVLKQAPSSAFLDAVRDLYQGGSPMSSQIARRVVNAFQQVAEIGGEGQSLSPREREILALLGRGNLYKEIAHHLGLSLETVRTHIHNIYAKLHVRSRTEAVMKTFGRMPSAT